LAQPETALEYVKEVMERSKPMLEAFLDEKGVDFWPSEANYLWSFPSDPGRVNQVLVDARILVRPKADGQGRMGLRITLGTEAQTRCLIEVLSSVL